MRTSFLAAVAAASLGFASLGSLARAQDGDARTWRFEGRALDMTTMLEQSHGGGTPENEVALSRVPVTVVVSAPGQPLAKTYQTETDLVGRFVVEGVAPPPGATLDFLVASEGGDGRPGFYAKPWVMDDEPAPEAVSFYERAETADDLFLAQVINIATVVESPDGSRKDVQFRHTAMLQNIGFKVWMGDLRGGPPVSFSAPIHDGFELRHVTMDGRSVDAETGQAGHGEGARFVWRQPIFPTGFQGGHVFQVLSVAPFDDGKVYGGSWHIEYPIMRYSLNIEEGQFHYLAPENASDGLALQDQGVQPAMGNTKKVTHAWSAEQVPAHSTIALRFSAGRTFPWRPVLWTSAIVMLVVGAILIGISISRREASQTAEIESAQKRVKVPPTEAGRSHELEMLSRRLKRGEITSVEYDVRKAAIERAAAAPVPARTAPAPRAPRTAKVDPALAKEIAQIAARVDDASPEQLRRDVQTLAKALRDVLGG